jgi:hypothetical protein
MCPAALKGVHVGDPFFFHYAPAVTGWGSFVTGHAHGCPSKPLFDQFPAWLLNQRRCKRPLIYMRQRILLGWRDFSAVYVPFVYDEHAVGGSDGGALAKLIMQAG